jgi:LysM repeat protein
VIRLCPASSSFLTGADGDDCSYTVKAGDTLFNIGKAHGLTVAQLLQYNPEIKDPDHIEVGQVRIELSASPSLHGAAQSSLTAGSTDVFI